MAMPLYTGKSKEGFLAGMVSQTLWATQCCFAFPCETCLSRVGRKPLTDSSNTSVVVLAKLDSQLNYNPDPDGNEAYSSNVCHDL